MQTIALWLYSLALWLAQPLLKRKLRRRAVNEPGYAMAVPERFGRYAQPVAEQGGPLVWIHAVSLGETRAAAILLKELRIELPGMRLLLTPVPTLGPGLLAALSAALAGLGLRQRRRRALAQR